MSDTWAMTEIVQPSSGEGWVYFIACEETQRVKIGYTKGNVTKRLKALQTGAAGQLRFIAKQPGSPETERAIHDKFAAHRLHGEWFEMSEDLFSYICAVVWIQARLSLNHNWPIEEWVLVGLRMMDDGVADLPPDLKALIAEPVPA